MLFALLVKGLSVRLLDSLQSRVHPKGKPSYLNSDAEFILGNTTIHKDLERVLDGVDAVFHCLFWSLPHF
jgi:dTDP-L-rhamnose 4-epimerase